jgi:hypothetical protein
MCADAAQPARASDYNPVFEKIVGDPKDPQIVELVAYGLYKIAKREWVQRKGRKPTGEELVAYADTWTEQQLQDKMTAAESALVVYAQNVIDDARPDILKEAFRGSGWKAFWIAIAAAVSYTIALVAIALILKTAGVDLIGVIEKVRRP